jgi:hypothetical protein
MQFSDAEATLNEVRGFVCTMSWENMAEEIVVFYFKVLCERPQGLSEG